MSTFDPTTGKLRDRNALKSIQVNASGRTKGWVAVDRAADTKTSEILDDDSGRSGGWATDHGDGRRDCTVTPAGVELSLDTGNI